MYSLFDKMLIFFNSIIIVCLTYCIRKILFDHQTFAIDSTRTDAMMICGVQHFNNSQWMMALEDFSLLLKQEPRNAVARSILISQQIGLLFTLCVVNCMNSM